MIEAKYLQVDGALGFVEIVTPENNTAATLPTVLCLHTAGQSGVQWRHVARALSEFGYRVIVPDLPGHGRSEPAVHAPIRSLSIYADWLWKILDLLDVRTPFVIGCSIGGKLTLELATRSSRPLAGAIAMEAEAAPGRVNVDGLRRELEDVASPSRADRTYLGTLASIGHAVPESRAHVIATMHKREDPEISSTDLIGWGTHDVRDRLGHITCPIHLIAGDEDPWIEARSVQSAVDAINESNPGLARYTLLEGVGHYPMEEVDDFASLAHRWLSDLSADSTVEAVS